MVDLDEIVEAPTDVNIGSGLPAAQGAYLIDAGDAEMVGAGDDAFGFVVGDTRSKCDFVIRVGHGVDMLIEVIPLGMLGYRVTQELRCEPRDIGNGHVARDEVECNFCWRIMRCNANQKRRHGAPVYLVLKYPWSLVVAC